MLVFREGLLRCDDTAHDQLSRAGSLIRHPDRGNTAGLQCDIGRIIAGNRPGPMEPINIHQAERHTAIGEIFSRIQPAESKASFMLPKVISPFSRASRALRMPWPVPALG